MRKLTRADLWGLERYAEERAAFRERVMAHKALRRVAVGPHATLLFEDALTIRYQVQEMLRVERIFEPAAIAEELAAYNPLIPDGGNLKATFLIEYEDVAERAAALARMPGVEHRVWMRMAGLPRAFAFANDDLERSSDEKTAAVHFLRFELTTEQIGALRRGEPARVGIDHDELRCEAALSAANVTALAADLDADTAPAPAAGRGRGGGEGR